VVWYSERRVPLGGKEQVGTIPGELCVSPKKDILVTSSIIYD